MSARARALPVLSIIVLAVFGMSCSDDNTAPSLALVLDQQVIVGETLRLVLSAEDPDGDRLDFDVSGLPKTAQVTPRAANEAVVVWSPLITDTQPGGRRYDVEVTVDDSRGGSSRQSIGVVVYPTFGIPAFTLPAGVVVNLGQQDDLELLVEVKDDDSTEVQIDLLEAPTDAKLQRGDKKVAHFFWRPDDEQRKVAVHRAIFSARDESHGPVTHVLTIVLLNGEKQSGCEGSPPTVTHTPPSDQNLASGGGALELGATASDAQSQVQSFTLHWTRGDPNGTYAAAAFERVTPNGPDWRVALDAGTLGNIPGSGSLVHYFLTATDNDDPTGVSCDQSTRFPKTGFFSAAVYPSGTSSDVCVDDLAEPDGDPSQAATLKAGTYAGRRLCGDTVDHVGVDAPAGTTLVAAVTWSADEGGPRLTLVDDSGGTLATGTLGEPGRLQLVHDRSDESPLWLAISGAPGLRLSYAIELTVEATRCEDDGAEPDSGPNEARQLALSASVSQKICSGDADFFRVAVNSGQRLHLAAAFDHRYGDLDLELRAADGVTVLATAASEKSLEEIEWNADTSETLIVRVYGVEGASNSYTLTADQGVVSGCESDGLGDNTSAAAAVILYQGVYEGFHACSDASDWFAVDLNGGETFSVLALADGAEHVSLRAYRDPGAAPIAEGNPDGSGFAELSVTATGPERLYYAVSTTSPTATYAVLQEVVDPPGNCQPDRLEPNDVASPAPIGEGVTTWLRMCGPGDVDAFRIEVAAFTSLIAFTVHATGSAYTDLELRSANGDILSSQTDFGDGAYLEEIIEQAGTYTLVVHPFDVEATGLGYDLGLFLD